MILSRPCSLLVNEVAVAIWKTRFISFYGSAKKIYIEIKLVEEYSQAGAPKKMIKTNVCKILSGL